MRICIATWAPFLAGAEVAAERLALGLKELGHEVSIVLGTQGETFARMKDVGLQCFYVPMETTDKRHFGRYLRGSYQLCRTLLRLQPDIVHANDLPTSQMIGQSAGWLRIPRVCHHRWVFDGKAIDWLNKYGAELHLFVSQALMDELTGSSRKLRQSRRAVVYDGLPLPARATNDDRMAARKELDLPLGKVVVTIAGQIIERKGHSDLIQAWAKLKRQASEKAILLVIGDDLAEKGAYREKMQRLAGELGVPARFVGFQKNVDLWLTASDIAVVPSHVEPLGNATLEAMALSLPVIGARVGGIPEMIIEGKTGLLVAPKDPAALTSAVERLVLDKDLCIAFGEAGRSHCEEKFSIEAHVKEMLHQYRSVMLPQAPSQE